MRDLAPKVHPDSHREEEPGGSTMGGWVRAALSSCAVLFSSALSAVAAYRLPALFGRAGVDVVNGGDGVDAGAAGGPVATAVPPAIGVAYVATPAGTTLADRPWLPVAVLVVALAAGWLAVRLLRRLRRRLLRPQPVASRGDFVGRTCLIRTGRVGPDFGQAEVRSDDGSTAMIQVRTDDTGLVAGSTALIFDYDADGEFFRVTPFDSALDPYHPSV